MSRGRVEPPERHNDRGDPAKDRGAQGGLQVSKNVLLEYSLLPIHPATHRDHDHSRRDESTAMKLAATARRRATATLCLTGALSVATHTHAKMYSRSLPRYVILSFLGNINLLKRNTQSTCSAKRRNAEHVKHERDNLSWSSDRNHRRQLTGVAINRSKPSYILKRSQTTLKRAK